MKEVVLFLTIVVLVSGCATYKKTYTQDGKEGYSIDCSGEILNWGMCYQKAGELCGERGYVVLEKSGDTGTTITAGQFGLFGGTGVYAHHFSNVFLIDALFDLCLDVHPVLLSEHRSPPACLGLAEGKSDASLRGTFYSGIYSTFNSGDDNIGLEEFGVCTRTYSLRNKRRG